LKPTFEVEVAEPEMSKPERVVVPKPVAETERRVVEAEETTSKALPTVLPHTDNRAYGEVVPTPTFPPMKVAEIGLAAVVDETYEAIVPREKIPEMPTFNPPPA
jgi:hypothetical protein